MSDRPYDIQQEFAQSKFALWPYDQLFLCDAQNDPASEPAVSAVINKL